MSTTDKTPELGKKELIEKERRKAGFLPQYSDYYFEGKSDSKISISIFILMFSGFFIGLASDLDFENKLVNFLLFFCIAQFVVALLSSLLEEHYKKRKGYYFETSEIRTDLYFRPFGVISYEAVYEAVKSGDISYRTDGLVIGHHPNRLIFHYEIGDSEAQKHAQETYALLQSHIPVKLPPFEAKTFDLLDRRYYYNKSMKNTLLILAGSLLFVVGLFAGFPISFSGNEDTIIRSVIEVVILIVWELYNLFQMFRYTRLYVKNYDALKERFCEFPNVRFGYRCKGYVLLLLTLLLVILVNLFIILFC